MYFVRRLGTLIVVTSIVCCVSTGNVVAQDDVQGEQLFLPQLAAQGAHANTVTRTAAIGATPASLKYASFEAREQVKPLPWLPPVLSPVGEPVIAQGESPVPGYASGGLPHPDADDVAQAMFASEWQHIKEAQHTEALAELLGSDGGELEPAEGSGTPNVFASYRTNYHGQMWRYYPYKTVGKVFFTDGVNDYSCTAAVMGQMNVIVTAAQCVYNPATASFYSDWVFVPAYRNGAAPYGLWDYHSVTVLPDWQTTSFTRYDVALIRLKYQYIDEGWRPVSYFTGWLGRIWDLDPVQLLFAQGYPGNLDGGFFTYSCAAESFSAATDVIGMGCDMASGSAGGPVIWRYHPYRGWDYNYAASVVSGGNPAEPTIYGARFSSDNIVRLCDEVPCGLTQPQPR